MLHIIEVATGKPTGDAIDRAQFRVSPSWLAGRPARSTTACRSWRRRRAGRPTNTRTQRVYVHKLGDDPEKDICPHRCRRVHAAVKLEPADITIVVQASSPYTTYIDRAGVSTERSANSGFGPAPVPQLERRQDTVGPGCRLRRRGDRSRDPAAKTVYLMTHKGTPHFKVLRTSLAKPDIAQAATGDRSRRKARSSPPSALQKMRYTCAR